MQKTDVPKAISFSKIFLVLIGFPIIATLLSLLLLNRSLIIVFGLDFINAFWIIIIIWYLLQIYLVARILKTAGWEWGDIGFTLTRKKTIYYISGYLIFAIGLFVFIELSLANSNVDTEKLNAISSLSPKTTSARIIFIIMGLVAGLSEEIVYRGFAVKALVSNKINQWFAILIAAIPFVFQHGLKSLDQFWWFFSMGIVFGLLFLLTKKLNLNIIIHWLVILSAMTAVLQAIQ